jgi:hypothetical protein
MALHKTHTIKEAKGRVGKTRLLSIDWEGDVCGKNHYLDILESSNKISRQEYTTLLENSGLYTQWTEKIKQWQ